MIKNIIRFATRRRLLKQIKNRLLYSVQLLYTSFQSYILPLTLEIALTSHDTVVEPEFHLTSFIEITGAHNFV